MSTPDKIYLRKDARLYPPREGSSCTTCWSYPVPDGGAEYIRADLHEAECERLRGDVARWQGVAERSLAHNDPLVAKLAASQAREARLREALSRSYELARGAYKPPRDETAEWVEFVGTGKEVVRNGDQFRNEQGTWCRFEMLNPEGVTTFRDIHYRRRVQKGEG